MRLCWDMYGLRYQVVDSESPAFGCGWMYVPTCGWLGKHVPALARLKKSKAKKPRSVLLHVSLYIHYGEVMK